MFVSSELVSTGSLYWVYRPAALCALSFRLDARRCDFYLGCLVFCIECSSRTQILANSCIHSGHDFKIRLAGLEKYLVQD